jgi:hypothetical protein
MHKLISRPPEPPPEPLYRNPFANWPPNLSCFCGSSFKFKKCHRFKFNELVTLKEYDTLKPDFERLLKHVEHLKKKGYVYYNTDTKRKLEIK